MKLDFYSLIHEIQYKTLLLYTMVTKIYTKPYTIVIIILYLAVFNLWRRGAYTFQENLVDMGL